MNREGFRNLFKDENLRKNGFLKTKDFKNSDEANKYISNIEDIQDKIGKMGNDILQSYAGCDIGM